MLCHCRQDTATNSTLGFGWVVCFVSQSIISNLKIAGFFFFFFFFRSRKMETDSGEFFFFNQMLTKCYHYNSGGSRGGARRPNEAQRADKERGDRPRPCPAPHSAEIVFFTFLFKGATLDIVSVGLVSNQGFCFRFGVAILTRWTRNNLRSGDFFFFWHSSRPQSTMHDLHFSP